MAIAIEGFTSIATGSTANAGTASSTITVPANTTFLLVAVSTYHSTANSLSNGVVKFTKGASQTNMTLVHAGGNASTSAFMSCMWYMTAPDTGSNKQLDWDWAGTLGTNNPNLFGLMFLSGVDQGATPLRAQSATQAGSLPYTSASMTGQSGDLIVACAGYYQGSTEGTINSWSNLTEYSEVTADSNSDMTWATNALTGSFTNTVAASTGTNAQDGSISACILKPVAAAGLSIPIAMHHYKQMRAQ